MSGYAIARFVSLHDGRQLRYLACGPRDGRLVLYLHGAIGSPHCTGPELDAVTHTLGIRYVMVSRPGFGGSDPAPGRSLLSFAADAAALADELGHDRFAVVGVSAGGPYALACAHELPERVAAAAVVSCMAPGGCSSELRLASRLGLCALRARPRLCTRAVTRCSASRGAIHGSSRVRCAAARRPPTTVSCSRQMPARGPQRAFSPLRKPGWAA
ncbi:MAG TPA: alpha/beta hydrolase [Solirubrobacteraceae bacterium]|nr:alpha/beta hydrolase [Solirubrobacteraceae bacterium]